jgi:hypothetical protein
VARNLINKLAKSNRRDAVEWKEMDRSERDAPHR